jgi:hypothetical protein
LPVEREIAATRRRRSQHELSYQTWVGRHNLQAEAPAQAVPEEIGLLDAELTSDDVRA